MSLRLGFFSFSAHTANTTFTFFPPSAPSVVSLKSQHSHSRGRVMVKYSRNERKEFNKKRVDQQAQRNFEKLGEQESDIIFNSVEKLLALIDKAKERKGNKKKREGRRSEDLHEAKIISESVKRLLASLKKASYEEVCRSKTLDKRSTKQRIVSLIDYNAIEKGTSGFKESNILGQGGFGCVYMATLDNNIPAAVKKLDCANEEAAKEFKSEVEILSKLQHPNIISLIGYSTNDTARFIVYELMPNISLESHLHGSSQGSAITWPMRMKIALDVARCEHVLSCFYNCYTFTI